ncbi:hypothetical protein FRC06_005848, partial [Ceratobasidium sp. 370]
MRTIFGLDGPRSMFILDGIRQFCIIFNLDMTKSIVFQNQTLLQKIYEKALDIFPRFSMTGPSLSTRASAHTPIHTPAWASSAGPVVAPRLPIHTQDPLPAIGPMAPTPQIPVDTHIADLV